MRLMYALNPLCNKFSVETCAKAIGAFFLLGIFVLGALICALSAGCITAVGGELPTTAHTVKFQGVVDQPEQRVQVTVVGGDEAVFKMLRYEMTDLLQLSQGIADSLSEDQLREARDHLAEMHYRRHVINQFLDIRFASVYDNPSLASKSPCIQFGKWNKWHKLPKQTNWESGDGLDFFEWLIRGYFHECYLPEWYDECDEINERWENSRREVDRDLLYAAAIAEYGDDSGWYVALYDEPPFIYTYQNGYTRLEIDLPVPAPPIFPEVPQVPPCPIGEMELFEPTQVEPPKPDWPEYPC